MTKEKAPAAKKMAKAQAKPLTPWQKWSAKPDEAIADLCRQIAQGENLSQFVLRNGLAYNTVRDWIDADEVRSAKYARAREDRADFLADEICAIADEAEVRSVIGPDGDVTLHRDATAVARNRLRVDARKWAAAKLKPKAYGDRTTLAGDAEAPVQHRIEGSVTLTPSEAYMAILKGR